MEWRLNIIAALQKKRHPLSLVLTPAAAPMARTDWGPVLGKHFQAIPVALSSSGTRSKRRDILYYAEA